MNRAFRLAFALLDGSGETRAPGPNDRIFDESQDSIRNAEALLRLHTQVVSQMGRPDSSGRAEQGRSHLRAAAPSRDGGATKCSCEDTPRQRRRFGAAGNERCFIHHHLPTSEQRECGGRAA